MFDIVKFRYLSDEERVDLLEQLLDGENADELFNNILNKGHGLTLHANQTSDELVKRTMMEMHDTSCFESMEEAKSFIDLAIYLKTSEIADWLVRSDRKPSVVLTQDVGEQAGIGVDINLNKKTTKYVSFKLERDVSPDNDFGFRIVTAYPNISKDLGEKTGKNYKEKALENVSELPSEMCRGYWALRLNNFHAYINHNVLDKYITVQFSHNDQKYTVKIDGITSPRLRIDGTDGRVTISPNNAHPEVKEAFDKIISVYDKATKEKSVSLEDRYDDKKFRVEDNSWHI